MSKAYKIYKRGMVADGREYEVGTVVKDDNGIPFAFNPANLFAVGSLIDKDGDVMEFTEVEPSDDITKVDGDAYLHSTSEMQIGNKVGIAQIAMAAVMYIEKVVDFQENFSRLHYKFDSSLKQRIINSDDYIVYGTVQSPKEMAFTGNAVQVIDAGGNKVSVQGTHSQVISTSSGAHISADGFHDSILSIGDDAKIHISSKLTEVVATGYATEIVSTADYTAIVTKGVNNRVTARGKYDSVNLMGGSSVAIVGETGRVRGVEGSTFIFIEQDNHKDTVVRVVKVDGENIKPDTWYFLNNDRIEEFTNDVD